MASKENPTFYEIYDSEVLRSWDIRVKKREIGGDEPGLTKDQYPPEVDEKLHELYQERLTSELPPYIARGATVLGPIPKEDGREIYVVYEVEYKLKVR